MNKILKKVLPIEIHKFLPKDAEEILIEASKQTQEKRNKILKKHAAKIFESLDSKDALPVKSLVISSSEEKLEKLVQEVYAGKKQPVGSSCNSCSDYPLILALVSIQIRVDTIRKKLKERGVKTKELDKYVYEKREKGTWSDNEVDGLAMDFVWSAIVTYYLNTEKKKDDACNTQKGVINASELEECQKIVEIGSVRKYLISLGYGGILSK